MTALRAGKKSKSLLSDWHRKRPRPKGGVFLYKEEMNVTVVCYGAMREFLPSDAMGNEATIPLQPGATIRDAVAFLGAPERLVHAVIVGDEPADLSRELREGDRLTLMPHYSGGQLGGRRG